MTLKNLNIYICQLCKKEYQSDGFKRPRAYRKDGSVHQYYDSKVFCSKECCLQQAKAKFKQTLSNNPNIIKKRVVKFKQSIKNNPGITKIWSENRKRTYLNNPEIMKKQIEKYKQTLKKHPEILKKSQEKRLQTYLNNPEIMKKSIEQHKQTLKNNPEILKKSQEKRLQTYKNHPEIILRAIPKIRETLKVTYQTNPDILTNARNKQKQTYKKQPEILKKASEKRKQTYLQQFKEQHPNYFELFKTYKDVLDYIENNNIKTQRELATKLNIDPCTLMNHLFQDFELDERFDLLLDGSISSYEKEIIDFLNQLGIKYQLHNRTIIKPYEIDIYIPDYKIGIEFNGDLYHGEYFYWNNELKFNKEPNYHQIKSKLCEEQNIFLLHIFEYEWIERRNIFLSMIRNLLNKNEYKIPARKCIIKEINSKTCNEFLNSNHLQRSDNSRLRYGLFYKDQLVSVMTFCKPRFNKKYDYELSRFCSLRNYTVIGGANKLFNHFIKQNSNKSIISYSNIAHTKGNVYEKLGFKLLDISNPNHVWFRYKRTGENKELKSIFKRYEVQKHKLVKQGLDKYGRTENEIMTYLGYYRIFDCGNKVWRYI